MKDIDFIKQQKLFYIASCSEKEVNLSPKGYDSIRMLDKLDCTFYQVHKKGNPIYL
ncbi:hypothetical protein ACLHDG_08665 [Sulfurovum sp. CS9]|jgi:hypothetical protein|uniref:hypothetical protein n=1 Tax=Sulfurovum sp. CS9 TaxID=3391146 RepID=UPI0039EC8D6F